VNDSQDGEALRILAEARLLEPTAWPLAQMQSEILRRTQGPEAALPVIQEFAQKNWWQYPAFLALGKLRAQQGDGAAALAALEHASRLDIRETEALNLITRIQMRARNLPAALAVQQRAVSRQPHEPSQYVLVSEVLMEMGRTREAAEARETALALQQQGRDSA
jgi:Flp pilus assembly protein TadD